MMKCIKMSFAIAVLFSFPGNVAAESSDCDKLLAPGPQIECRWRESIKNNPNWDSRTKNAIVERKIFLGMSAEAVRASLRDPMRINRSVGSYWVHEQWVYPNAYLYFENGVLKSFQQSR